MSNDYNWSKFTPLDNTGHYSIFRSAYKNIRFLLPVHKRIVVTQRDMADLPGIAYREFGDTTYWRLIMEYNGLKKALDDVYPGLTLNLPKKADVIAHLSRQQDNQPTFDGILI